MRTLNTTALPLIHLRSTPPLHSFFHSSSPQQRSPLCFAPSRSFSMDGRRPAMSSSLRACVDPAAGRFFPPLSPFPRSGNRIARIRKTAMRQCQTAGTSGSVVNILAAETVTDGKRKRGRRTELKKWRGERERERKRERIGGEERKERGRRE